MGRATLPVGGQRAPVPPVCFTRLSVGGRTRPLAPRGAVPPVLASLARALRALGGSRSALPRTGRSWQPTGPQPRRLASDEVAHRPLLGEWGMRGIPHSNCDAPSRERAPHRFARVVRLNLGASGTAFYPNGHVLTGGPWP